MKIIAIGYHSIGDQYGKLSLPPELFRSHVSYLKSAGYTFLQFQDLTRIQIGELSMPKKPVVIYFDDGYRDVLTNAYPIVKQFGARATLFVTTGFVDKTTQPRWADGTQGEKMFLSWDEIKKMNDIFEIGSHSVTHKKFTKLQLPDIKKELVDSRNRIAETLGFLPTAFSFPHSAWTEESKQAVLEAGYQIAVGIGRGYNYGPEYTFLKKIPVGSRDNTRALKRKLRYLPFMEFGRRVTGLFSKL